MGCWIVLGEEKKKKKQQKALLLELADGLVLDSDNAFILLCQASSAAKNRGEGREREKYTFQYL